MIQKYWKALGYYREL